MFPASNWIRYVAQGPSQGMLDSEMSKYRKRNHRRITGGHLSGALATLLLLFVIWLQLCAAATRVRQKVPLWRAGYTGDGTTHEQLGQVHFSAAKLSRYHPLLNYTTRRNGTRSLDGFLKWSRGLYDAFFPHDATVPLGYLRFVGTDNMRMGSKVENNDWAPWFSAYWLFWFWVILIVALIVLMPCLGVLYCCFSWYRCRQGCPPCDAAANRRRRCVCGTCLLLIIIVIGLCMALALYSNSLLEGGLAKTKTTMETGSLDTCNFLLDVKRHMNHLLRNNYEELETHLSNMIMTAPKHIAADLNDASNANSLRELDRIFTNLGRIIDRSHQGEKYEWKIKSSSVEYKEALRGVKRDVNFASTVLCGTRECIKFLGRSDIEFIDTSRCLHPDKIPSMKRMRSRMEELFVHADRPKEALQRLHNISELIKEEMERVASPMMRDIKNGRKVFAEEAKRINEIIEVVISDIHLATLRSAKAFDDLYDRFNTTRYYIVVYIAVMVFVILAILITALVFGVFGQPVHGVRDTHFSRKNGSYLLLFAMTLICCVISIMFMIGLFYFLIGAVAYKGACAPLSANERSASPVPFFEARHTDAQMLRISNIIRKCEGNNVIFRYLREERIYDVADLQRIKVMRPRPTEETIFQDLDLSAFYLLTEEDKEAFTAATEDEFSVVHPDLWYDNLCYQYVPLDIKGLAQGLRKLGRSLPWSGYYAAKAAFENEYQNLKAFHTKYHDLLTDNIRKMLRLIEELDKALLYERYNFGDSVKLLLDNILTTEKFIQDRGRKYLTNIGKNLTEVVQEQIDNYVRMIVREANTNVGQCQPLTYIYERSMDAVCGDMVDPMVGYWMGILVSAFLLMIVLCIGHRLQCLYKQIQMRPYVVPAKMAATVAQCCPYCCAREQRLAGGDSVYCPAAAGAGAGTGAGTRTAIFDVEQTIGEATNHPLPLPSLVIRDSESSIDGKDKLD